MSASPAHRGHDRRPSDAARPGRTLLGVWAHPADEAFLAAGLMAEFVASGDRVVVVTATAGEHGWAGSRNTSPDDLGRRRREELRHSLDVLGVREHTVLGLRDGRCAEQDATGDIAGHIVDVEPDVIVTFGPDGLTGHPDHRAVSQWTTDAWLATSSEAALWYATVTPSFHLRWGDVNEHVGLWADQPEPPRTEIEDLCHRIVLSRARIELKDAALRAHDSQTSVLADLIGPRTFRHWWSTETFRAPTSTEIVEGQARVARTAAGCPVPALALV